MNGMGMHVVLVGNPVDGLTIYGPFTTGEDANDWADSNVKNEDWWAAPLASSATETENAVFPTALCEADLEDEDFCAYHNVWHAGRPY
jgi:hypothetical protein